METRTTPKRRRLVKQYQSNKQFMQKNTAEIHKKQHFISPMMAGVHGQKRVTPMPSKKSTQEEVPISKRIKSTPNQKIGASKEELENLKKRPTIGTDKFLETHRIHLEREDDDFEPTAKNERSIQEKQQNLRKINTKLSCQAMRLDIFLETNGIHVEGEEEHSGANANDDDDDDDDDDDFSDDEDYVGEYEDAVLHGDDNHLMKTNNVEDTPKTTRTRGKTRCAKINARSWEEREESKFILPKEQKEWVITGVREAWKGYKIRIKGKHFEIYNNIEDMLKIAL
ncbi:chromatin modification-related protein EAF7-like [Arachis stenosperma]|uniref:chromatin modification-related protein EAF7-like n=1 Tax=Arachis stenosperma TaxID=217475 RepID=UPI0025AC53A5|nr:chromatin modification-related protein EAF7-like [Arachis stenosperma]